MTVTISITTTIIIILASATAISYCYYHCNLGFFWGWYWKTRTTFPGKKSRSLEKNIYGPWKKLSSSTRVILWSCGPLVLWSCTVLALWPSVFPSYSHALILSYPHILESKLFRAHTLWQELRHLVPKSWKNMFLLSLKQHLSKVKKGR